MKTTIEKTILKTFRQIHFTQMGARDRRSAERRRATYPEYKIPQEVKDILSDIKSRVKS